MSQFIFRVLWLIWSKHSSFFFEFPVRKQFPLVLLQAKAVRIIQKGNAPFSHKFPLVLLQAKAVRAEGLLPHHPKGAIVSISSPSGEGGEKIYKSQGIYHNIWRNVSISSPSGEGGEVLLLVLLLLLRTPLSFH